MTNKEWYDTLNEFEKAIIIVNFIRNNIPEYYTKTDEQAVKKAFQEWLKQEKQ